MRMLGKLAPRHDPRTLRLARYLPILPPPPPTSDWTRAVSVPWGDMLNSSIGLCTFAGAGHLQMLWTANASTLVVPTDAEILGDYSALTGYNPSNPNSDTGAAELDVLNYWRNHGIAGRKILGFMALDPRNREQVKTAIHLFGGIYVGVAMPDSWEGQLDNQEPWTWAASDRPNPNNGHALPMVEYDSKSLTCITWGQKQPLSWDWFFQCCDEAYAVLSLDWINGPDSPSALDMAALEADLKALEKCR